MKIELMPTVLLQIVCEYWTMLRGLDLAEKWVQAVDL